MGEQAMASGAIEVRDDGTLLLTPSRAQNPQGLADALSLFAERLPSSEAAPHYRLSAASVWRGRRLGLSLEKMVETLERHSGQALPPKLREDLTRWSGQIDRLRLEVEGDRLILSSPNPLVITAVMSHRTLGPLVTKPIDRHRVELMAAAYPNLIATFDACDYPVLDQVPTDWVPLEPTSAPRPPRVRSRTTGPRGNARRAASAKRKRQAAAPRQCQAITTRGRPCKNRATSSTPYCRVHSDHEASPGFDLEILSRMLWHASLEAHEEEEEALLSPVQMARGRIVILMGLGLCTWLVFHLLRAGLLYGLGWSLPAWLLAGVAGVLSCGVWGRLMVGLGVLSTLGYVGLYVGSIGWDCLHKEGLILNLCYVVIPVLLPLWVLSQMDLSWPWVFACFPVGLWVGELLYVFLDASSA
jgi:hypothetical protein